MSGSRFLHPTTPGGLMSILTLLKNQTVYSPAAAGTATIDLSKGIVNTIQMPAGNVTIALANVPIGAMFVLRIIQDSVGSRTVTWFSTIHWPGGSPPTLATAANHWDTIAFIRTAANTYDGFVLGANIS